METSTSRPKKRKTFFLLNDSRLHKRETWLSYTLTHTHTYMYIYIYMYKAKQDVMGHIKSRDGLLLMVVNESFYTVMHDILYFLTDGNMWIPYKACHIVLFI